jgi:integrase
MPTPARANDAGLTQFLSIGQSAVLDGRGAYSDRFAVLSRQAGVPKLAGVHDVRHTLALIMHRNGVAPADAAALLGHTLAVHLSTYVPLTERGARTAASGLGAALVKFS